MMDYIKVLIVDDNPVIRMGLKSLLEEEDFIDVVGEASTGSEALEWIARSPANVVLMDIRMPGMDGIKATAEILRIRPQVHILIVTALDEPAILAQAIRAGARGCLVYSHCCMEDIKKAIQNVALGETLVMPPSIALALAELAGDPQVDCLGMEYGMHSSLTLREEQILNLLSKGESNAEIGRTLGIEEKTVKNHITSLYSKLNIRSRYEAIRLRLRPFE